MATYKLNSKGIQRIQKMMEKRVTACKKESALKTREYLLNFGYHVFSPGGGPWKDPVGYTDYYAANWNVGIGAPDTSVIQPVRTQYDLEGKYTSDVLRKQALARPIGKIDISDDIYLTNNVDYGPVLNEGGLYNGDQLRVFYKERGKIDRSKKLRPLRFMEQAKEYLNENIPGIIKSVAGEE